MIYFFYFFGIYINKAKTELVYCGYHVALLLPDNDHEKILDPAFFNQPVTRAEWEAFLNRYSLEYQNQYQIIESNWKNFYGPEQMILSAAGAVDHDALMKMAEEMFGHLQPRRGLVPETARFTGGEARQEKELHELLKEVTEEIERRHGR